MPYSQDIRFKGDYTFNVCVFYDYLSSISKKIINTDDADKLDISTYDNPDFEKELDYYMTIFVNWKIFGEKPSFITDTGSKMTPDNFDNPMEFLLDQMTTRYMKANQNYVLVGVDDDDSSDEEDEPKIDPRTQIHECDVCGRTYKGFGNNAQPLKLMGQCCDTCNKYVVAYRILASQLDDLEECSTKDAYRKHLKEKKKEFIKQAIKEYEGSDDDE